MARGFCNHRLFIFIFFCLLSVYDIVGDYFFLSSVINSKVDRSTPIDCANAFRQVLPADGNFVTGVVGTLTDPTTGVVSNITGRLEFWNIAEQRIIFNNQTPASCPPVPECDHTSDVQLNPDSLRYDATANFTAIYQTTCAYSTAEGFYLVVLAYIFLGLVTVKELIKLFILVVALVNPSFRKNPLVRISANSPFALVAAMFSSSQRSIILDAAQQDSLIAMLYDALLEDIPQFIFGYVWIQFSSNHVPAINSMIGSIIALALNFIRLIYVVMTRTPKEKQNLAKEVALYPNVARMQNPKLKMALHIANSFASFFIMIVILNMNIIDTYPFGPQRYLWPFWGLMLMKALIFMSVYTSSAARRPSLCYAFAMNSPISGPFLIMDSHLRALTLETSFRISPFWASGLLDLVILDIPLIVHQSVSVLENGRTKYLQPIFLYLVFRAMFLATSNTLNRLQHKYEHRPAVYLRDMYGDALSLNASPEMRNGAADHAPDHAADPADPADDATASSPSDTSSHKDQTEQTQQQEQQQQQQHQQQQQLRYQHQHENTGIPMPGHHQPTSMDILADFTSANQGSTVTSISDLAARFSAGGVRHDPLPLESWPHYFTILPDTNVWLTNVVFTLLKMGQYGTIIFFILSRGGFYDSIFVFVINEIVINLLAGLWMITTEIRARNHGMDFEYEDTGHTGISFSGDDHHAQMQPGGRASSSRYRRQRDVPDDAPAHATMGPYAPDYSYHGLFLTTPIMTLAMTLSPRLRDIMELNVRKHSAAGWAFFRELLFSVGFFLMGSVGVAYYAFEMVQFTILLTLASAVGALSAFGLLHSLRADHIRETWMVATCMAKSSASSSFFMAIAGGNKRGSAAAPGGGAGGAAGGSVGRAASTSAAAMAAASEAAASGIPRMVAFTNYAKSISSAAPASFNNFQGAVADRERPASSLLTPAGAASALALDRASADISASRRPPSRIITGPGDPRMSYLASDDRDDRTHTKVAVPGTPLDEIRLEDVQSWSRVPAASQQQQQQMQMQQRPVSSGLTLDASVVAQRQMQMQGQAAAVASTPLSEVFANILESSRPGSIAVDEHDDEDDILDAYPSGPTVTDPELASK